MILHDDSKSTSTFEGVFYDDILTALQVSQVYVNAVFFQDKKVEREIMTV